MLATLILNKNDGTRQIRFQRPKLPQISVSSSLRISGEAKDVFRLF